MLIELNILGDVYGLPTEEGKPNLIKKNVQYKRLFDTVTIKAEEYINEKGKVLKSYVNIIEGDSTFKAKHPYKDIVIKLQPIEIKGFIRHGKKSIKN